MGSLSSPKIPVINFNVADLKPGTSSWLSVRAEVHQALEEYGIFEAVYGDTQIHQSAMEALKQLFDLPLETRRKHPASDRTRGGPLKATLPLWENVGIFAPQDYEPLKNLTNLMWPEGNSSFCESIYSYVKQVVEMEKLLKRMVFESLGVERYYDSMDEVTTFRMQVNNYRTPKTNEADLGLALHYDTSFMTILSQNDVHGLETETKDGQWIKITPLPSSFVVFAGDGLLAWCNGRIYSALHKVTMNSEKMRYSIAMFSFMKGTIQTPEELVDENHPLRFKPFNHLGFREFMSTKEGQNAECAIEAYCGI